MKTSKKWLLIPLSFFSFTLTAFAAFSDLDPGDGHYVAITWLTENGIIEGYDDNTFRSNDYINRAEALKMLTLSSGLFSEEEIENSEMEVNEAPFSDVSESDWFAKYLIKAKEKGIISGYDDNSFKPEKNINLAESLKIMLESYDNIIYPDIENNLFADTPSDAWFTKYTAYAKTRDMLHITGENRVYPEQTMTRGYMAELIYRKKKSGEGYSFGKATFYGAAVQGHYTASGEIFDKDAMTAAHKTLPFGTVVEVTNLDNGKSVQVRITDRGPYGHGRIIDLSSGAFKQIAPISLGVINVQLKVIEN